MLTEPVDSATRYFLPIGAVMTKSLSVLLILFSQIFATTAYGQDDVDKKIFEKCKWVAQVAKEIMTARQREQPMSETLAFKLDQVRELLGETADMDDLNDSQLEQLKVMEQGLTEMVMGAYETPLATSDEDRRELVNSAEVAAFTGCYEGALEAYDELAPTGE